MKNILFYFALILNLIVGILYFIPENDYVIVEIKGYVKNPGVYTLLDGSTVNDLIIMSGGLVDDSNTTITNQAKKLNNEDVVIIYSNDEVNNMYNGQTKVKYIDKECICPRISNNSCLKEYISNDSSIVTTGKVSINSATINELTTLPGIGESKAISIIKYREENNGFKELEELTNVKGIGKSIYEKIKPFITL